MCTPLDALYWNDRYQAQRMGWDLGAVSPPLKAYIDQLEDKNLKILVPGGGNGYEVEYLYHQGFQKVYAVDLALKAKANFMERNPGFPEGQYLVKDFFDLQDEFDLILEQTFFCALHPSQRALYAQKAHQLLRTKGKLVGLLFDAHFDGGPPFGGDAVEYRAYFEPYFDVGVLERCFNSIAPRAGRELFIHLTKKEVD